MVDRRTCAGILLSCIGNVRTACCQPHLPADRRPHRLAHVDPASDIDARPPANSNGYGDSNDHAGGDPDTHRHCDVDSESFPNSNRLRYFDLISHCNGYIRSYRHRHPDFDCDGHSFLHARPHTDAASLSHP